MNGRRNLYVAKDRRSSGILQRSLLCRLRVYALWGPSYASMIFFASVLETMLGEIDLPQSGGKRLNWCRLLIVYKDGALQLSLAP